jgi:hypothetical protein
VPKAFASMPSEPSAECGSARPSGGSRRGCVSVTVLDDEACEGALGGRGAALWSSCVGCGDEAGDALSSSGFAMRSPPRDCDRLRSPFIVAATGQLGRETSER